MTALQHLQVARLAILSRHPVLDQVARDIAAGLTPDSLPDEDITLYVGLHRNYGPAQLRRGRRIAIQTEQYFDAQGLPMWRNARRWRTWKAALLCHHILDLSPSNAPHYDCLPQWLRRKVLFGPHIFPSAPPTFVAAQDTAVLFIGNTNARRAEILASLPEGAWREAPPETYGAALAPLIAEAAGLLNIHYTDRIYAEYPRLLAACIGGKIVVSEPLGTDLVPGRDYIALERIEDIATGSIAPEAVFAAFWRNFARHYSLSAFLHRLTRPGSGEGD